MPACEPGLLVIFPRTMDDGYPGFAVGKLIKPTGKTTWEAQWYGSLSDTLLGQFRPCWADGHSFYYADTANKATHVPYTTVHTNTKLEEKEIADCGFKLTAGLRVPQPTLERVTKHKAFEWQHAIM